MISDHTKHPEPARSEIDETLRRVDSLLILDSRRPDEILGYDEHGLPQ
jgi:hypothetical protein